MADDNSGDFSWKKSLSAVGLALAIPGTIGIPAYLGWVLDHRFGTFPLWFAILLVAGLSVAALDLYYLVRQFGSK